MAMAPPKHWARRSSVEVPLLSPERDTGQIVLVWSGIYSLGGLGSALLRCVLYAAATATSLQSEKRDRGRSGAARLEAK